MKRVLPVLIMVFAGLTGRAQQKPQYTQYVLNNLLLNPAVSGIENYIDLKAGYRNQWTGLNGAPVTSTLSVSAPIGSAFVGGDAASMSAGTDNPYSPAYAQNYQAAPPHHGIGFTLVSDQIGYTKTTNINATYAYHLGLSDNLNLSLGVAAGFNNTSLNTSQILLQEPDDNALKNISNGSWSPDLSLGVWAYSSGYYVGLSALQLLPRHLSLSTTNAVYQQNKLTPNFFVTAGVKFSLSDDVAFVPSAMVKMINPLPASFDLNTKMVFSDRFWVGCSYRYQDAVAGMLGLNINSLLNVSYSYDYGTSPLHSVSTGSHEIVIGLMLNNRDKVICPRHSF
jgi:type IX secretion system PorP/SprF family membrane protein